MGAERVKYDYHIVNANIVDAFTTTLLGSMTNPWVKKVTLIAKKTNVTANTSPVQVSTQNGLPSGPIILNPGDIWVIDVAPNCEFSLSDWFFKVATDGDGLLVIHH